MSEFAKSLASILKESNSWPNSSHNASEIASNRSFHLLDHGLDLCYLCLLSLAGTLGNLLIIFSLLQGKNANKHVNAYIINIAFADLLVTGGLLPIAVGNQLKGGNILEHTDCSIAGYLLCLCCANSASGEACIALNRYWYVVRKESYGDVFTKKGNLVVVLLNWTWCNIITLPTKLGWSKLWYDEKTMMCTFDVSESFSYNLCLLALGALLPIFVTAFCYFKLFNFVDTNWKKFRRWSGRRPSFASPLEKIKLRKQKTFAWMLVVTVLAMVLCFLPYSLMSLADQKKISSFPSKVVGRLLLTKFAMNFVVYGVMSPAYRRGYVAFFERLLGLKPKFSSRNAVRRNDVTVNGEMEMENFQME